MHGRLGQSGRRRKRGRTICITHATASSLLAYPCAPPACCLLSGAGRGGPGCPSTRAFPQERLSAIRLEQDGRRVPCVVRGIREPIRLDCIPPPIPDLPC